MQKPCPTLIPTLRASGRERKFGHSHANSSANAISKPSLRYIHGRFQCTIWNADAFCNSLRLKLDQLPQCQIAPCDMDRGGGRGGNESWTQWFSSLSAQAFFARQARLVVTCRLLPRSDFHGRTAKIRQQHSERQFGQTNRAIPKIRWRAGNESWTQCPEPPVTQRLCGQLTKHIGGVVLHLVEDTQRAPKEAPP